MSVAQAWFVVFGAFEFALACVIAYVSNPTNADDFMGAWFGVNVALGAVALLVWAFVTLGVHYG